MMTRLCVLPLAAAGALALGGCVDAGSEFVILQNMIPTATSTPTESRCTLPGGRTESRATLGTFDVALDKPYPYFMYPYVVNRLPSINEGLASELNQIDVSTWQVKIVPPPGVQVAWNPACPPQFDYPSFVALLPGDGASHVVEAMRPCHSELLAQLFRAGRLSSDFAERILFRIVLRAKGRHGSTEIISDPFDFPVRVCFGCLQTGFLDPMFVDFSFPKTPQCSRLASNPYRGNPCNVAQDGPAVLCCAEDSMAMKVQCPGVPRARPTGATP